jgi:hypothetical protein
LAWSAPNSPIARALHDVDELAAAVVALAGIAFGVLVRQDRAGGFEHGRAHEVFRRDQLEAAVLPVQFVAQRGGDLGIGLGECPPHRRGRGIGGHIRFPHCAARPKCSRPLPLG